MVLVSFRYFKNLTLFSPFLLFLKLFWGLFRDDFCRNSLVTRFIAFFGQFYLGTNQHFAKQVLSNFKMCIQKTYFDMFHGQIFSLKSNWTNKLAKASRHKMWVGSQVKLSKKGNKTCHEWISAKIIPKSPQNSFKNHKNGDNRVKFLKYLNETNTIVFYVKN